MQKTAVNAGNSKVAGGAGAAAAFGAAGKIGGNAIVPREIAGGGRPKSLAVIFAENAASGMVERVKRGTISVEEFGKRVSEITMMAEEAGAEKRAIETVMKECIRRPVAVMVNGKTGQEFDKTMEFYAVINKAIAEVGGQTISISSHDVPRGAPIF